MNEKRISRSIEKLMKKLPERNGEDIPHISETINFRPIECQGMAEAFRREFIDNGGGNALVIKTASGYQIRYMRNGYKVVVFHENLAEAKKLFCERAAQ